MNFQLKQVIGSGSIQISEVPYCPCEILPGFHDGPDVRLMPVQELGKAYKSILSRTVNLKYMSYVETPGIQKFREVLSEYLNSSRGLQTRFENIMVTRGSQHGLYLLTCVLFSAGENIIVGDTNYYYADHCFKHAGMQSGKGACGRIRHRCQCH